MRVTHNIDFYLLDKVFTPPKKTCIQAFFAAGADCSWFEFSFKANLVRVTLPMFDSNQSVFVILPVKVAAYEIRTWRS